MKEQQWIDEKKIMLENMNKENKKELPPIEDKIQQIFKFLEIADVSQWQGMNVFEAGDADSLYGILQTAFEQIEQSAYDKAIEVLEGKKCRCKCDTNNRLDEAISEINKLKNK